MNEVNLESLLSQISPEAPSGESDIENDPEFIELKIKMAGTPEREYDGKIVQEAKEPNWREVKTDAAKLLTKCHDLRVAMFLVQALLHTDGIDGLCTGLDLLHGYISQYWESHYPRLDPIDNFDPIERSNILASLSEGQEIITPLMKTPLCASPALGRFGYRDILIANGKINVTDTDKHEMKEIEAAFKDTDVNVLTETQTAIEKSLEKLNLLRTEMIQKAGTAHSENVPNFSHLSDVLSEMNAIIKKQMKGHKDAKPSETKQKKTSTSDIKENERSSEIPFTSDKPMNEINGRKDVIRMLDLICTYYEKNEPGSPIPLLLKRARQLVEMNFIEIIQDLAPDSAGKIKSLIIGAEKK